jgi:hypothetical protein
MSSDEWDRDRFQIEEETESRGERLHRWVRRLVPGHPTMILGLLFLACGVLSLTSMVITTWCVAALEQERARAAHLAECVRLQTGPVTISEFPVRIRGGGPGWGWVETTDRGTAWIHVRGTFRGQPFAVACHGDAVRDLTRLDPDRGLCVFGAMQGVPACRDADPDLADFVRAYLRTRGRSDGR